LDGGITWSEPVPFVHTVKKTYYPGSLTTLSDGRLLHCWNCWDTPVTQKEPRRVLYSLSDDDGVSWGDPQPFPCDPEVTTVIRHPIAELMSKQWLVSLWDRTFAFDPATSKAAPFGDGRVHGLIPIVQTPKGTFVSGAGIRSTDNGKTWQTSEPFEEMGTGEATLAELSDGRIYYNSRRHWAPKDKNPLRRWVAMSEDDGATWSKPEICEILPDGDQNRPYGLMGGLVRLPVKGRDILIYSNIVSPAGRHHGTLWASFDGGRTWPVKRLVDEGAFAYSSLDAGRPGTPSEGWIYLLYESRGGKVARLNLSWLLKGEKTGDGEVPALP